MGAVVLEKLVQWIVTASELNASELVWLAAEGGLVQYGTAHRFGRGLPFLFAGSSIELPEAKVAEQHEQCRRKDGWEKRGRKPVAARLQGQQRDTAAGPSGSGGADR